MNFTATAPVDPFVAETSPVEGFEGLAWVEILQRLEDHDDYFRG